jgi:hypothetical protein
MSRVAHRLARTTRPAASSLVVALLSLGCDGTEPLRATALAILMQPPGAAPVGIFLPPIAVELRDERGRAVARAGTVVTVTIADGGGTFTGPASQVTDAEGRATFGDIAFYGPVGPRTLRFSATGLTPATSTPINVTAGYQATAQAVSPVNLQATVGTAVTPLPSVIVKDQSGNPVPNVVVAFWVSGTSSAGQLTGAQQITGASGVATLGGWVLPTTPGQYALDARVLGRSGTIAFIVRFTATATP